MNYKNRLFSKVVSMFLLLVLAFSSFTLPWADVYAVSLPLPTQLVNPSAGYSLPILKGLRFDPKNPLDIEFIIDTKDKRDVTKQEADILVSYFVAALAMPKDDLWVNLSPYEKDRIIPESLSVTPLGEGLLEQDYLLKQFASSLTYPQSATGKDYWQAAGERPQAFSKVWIMPDKAKVYEKNNAVVITQATLKVMTQENNDAMRDIIIPEITKDVNNGKNFAQLRQIYNAVILAQWFKQNLSAQVSAPDSGLNIYFSYIDQGKTRGIDTVSMEVKKEVYGMYNQSFKNGLYDYKKTITAANKYVTRQYFSGGINLGVAVGKDSTPGALDPDDMKATKVRLFPWMGKALTVAAVAGALGGPVVAMPGCGPADQNKNTDAAASFEAGTADAKIPDARLTVREQIEAATLEQLLQMLKPGMFSGYSLEDKIRIIQRIGEYGDASAVYDLFHIISSNTVDAQYEQSVKDEAKKSLLAIFEVYVSRDDAAIIPFLVSIFNQYPAFDDGLQLQTVNLLGRLTSRDAQLALCDIVVRYYYLGGDMYNAAAGKLITGGYSTDAEILSKIHKATIAHLNTDVAAGKVSFSGIDLLNRILDIKNWSVEQLNARIDDPIESVRAVCARELYRRFLLDPQNQKLIDAVAAAQQKLVAPLIAHMTQGTDVSTEGGFVLLGAICEVALANVASSTSLDTLGVVGRFEYAFDVLLKVLAQPEEYQSPRARIGIMELFKRQPLEKVRVYFSDTDYRVRGLALLGINKRNAAAMVDEIIAIAKNDSSSAVKGEAIAALCDTRDPRIIDALIDVLRHDDQYERLNTYPLWDQNPVRLTPYVIPVLGEMKAVQAVPDLIKMFDYKDDNLLWTIAVDAAAALTSIGNNEAIEAVTQYVQGDIAARIVDKTKEARYGPVPSVVYEIFDGNYDTKWMSLLTYIVKNDPDPYSRKIVCEGFGEVKDNAALPLLEDILATDADESVQYAAKEAIAVINAAIKKSSNQIMDAQIIGSVRRVGPDTYVISGGTKDLVHLGVGAVIGGKRGRRKKEDGDPSKADKPQEPTGGIDLNKVVVGQENISANNTNIRKVDLDSLTFKIISLQGGQAVRDFLSLIR